MEYIKSGVRATCALDFAVMLAWAACAITLLATDCWEHLAVIHALIFIHFVGQTAPLYMLYQGIKRDEKEVHTHQLMVPMEWGAVSFITLVGDLFVLSYDVLHFRATPSDDHCYGVSAFQTSVDAANALVATCSLLCYAVAAYHITYDRADSRGGGGGGGEHIDGANTRPLSSHTSDHW